jgi:hypothetical protein
MLWFILHQFLQIFPSLENQTRNLITFLTGTTFYAIFYSYIGSFDFSDNLFFKRLFGFFVYIILADAFSMAIIYKNYYKHTILSEINETFGSSPKIVATNVEVITEAETETENENENEYQYEIQDETE